MNKLKVILLFITLLFILHCTNINSDNSSSTKSDASYSGSEKCKSCHLHEFNEYSQSTHFHAMDNASEQTVKGNFNNCSIDYFGDNVLFYKSGKDYFVNTIDSNGKNKAFKISYTIGWYPLQQYLVSFPDGRIQTLPFCWDTRPKDQGGQRWFHIYGKERISPNDELFWMGINQNWNNMCADCHTTDYFKNYKIDNNTFQSAWKENRVSCESCHGPASKHMEWTKQKNKSDSNKGFQMRLKSEMVNWVMNKERGIAFPDKKLNTDPLIETCARCHARAVRVSDNYQHGNSLLQTHIPSTIHSDHFFVDGQIKSEDYEYASFLQSKMYASGVTCMNCHNPHSMKLKAEGNSLCASCHEPAKFDIPSHTHHPLNSTGASCVNCHMPTTNYMVVDERRDHSIRIPRPDLSESLGTPNACNKCHTNKPVKWAATAFTKWYGQKIPNSKTYGELLNLMSKKQSGSEKAMNDLLKFNYPEIAKATALQQNQVYYSKQSIEQITSNLKSNSANLRLNSLRAMAGLQRETQFQLASNLLFDNTLVVRTEALKILAPMHAQLEGENKTQFEKVLDEAIQIEKKMSDRPEGYMNLGILYVAIGRLEEAEKVYMQGLQRHPKFIGLFVNLADYYQHANQEHNSKKYLELGLKVDQSHAGLHFALGLWYIRNKDKNGGIKEIAKAYELTPSDAYFAYVYAIGLDDLGQTKQAINILEKYLEKNSNDIRIVEALIMYHSKLQQNLKASYYQNLRNTL